MELTELKDRIIANFKGEQTGLEEILSTIEVDQAIFPFNEYEHLLFHLMERGGMTFDEYRKIRAEYISQNPNLWIFEISAPRQFGERFAQTYVQAKSSKLRNPSNQLDPNYSGQYDLWMDGIKIEVKASRAVDQKSDEPLYMKALSKHTTKPFLMNFQQLKPQCCDVFIWVAVFRDEIVLWVMNSDTVLHHPLFSKGQDRGNKGNEGQLHITHENIHLLNQYQLKDDDLAGAILQAVADKGK